MYLLMLETRRGSPDGYRVHLFEKGRVVDVPDQLARAFLAAGWANKYFGEESATEEKPAKPKPRNKPKKPSAISSTRAERMKQIALQIQHLSEE